MLELDTSFFFSSGDAVIATSRTSVDVVRRAQGFRERFYLPSKNGLPGDMDGLTCLRLYNWETKYEALEQAILKQLRTLEPGHTRDGIRLQRTAKPGTQQPRFKASVVLPTYNAGAMLRQVLNALSHQDTPWEFQCVLIDSASNDGTLAQLQSFARRQANASVHQIDQQDFQHGYTRNQGIAWSDAEFVAFLTQDAIPADKDWLVNLVSAMENEPKAAGCFGRHIAHDDAPLLIKQELDHYFSSLDQFPRRLSIHTDPEAIKQSDRRWRQVLHFYSDNNSCLRKSIWEDIPLPCVPFGEDQLWAETIIRRGYSKIYANNAIVKHSHNYTPKETYNRARIEAGFYAACFGHTIHATRIHMDHAISRECNTAVNRAIRAKDQHSQQHLATHIQCIIAKNCGCNPAVQQPAGPDHSTTDQIASTIQNLNLSSRAKLDTP